MGNMWDDRYSIADYYYGKKVNSFLQVVAGLIPKGGEVLCLAEGEGRNAVYLASLGLNVTAVDFSVIGREKALALAASQNCNIDYLIADLNNFIFPKKFDAVISIWCHLPRELRQKIHKQSEAGLVAGGLFILESYNPKQLEYKTGGPANRELLYTEPEITEDFFEIEWLLSQEAERVISEGTGHAGKSATLQMIGRKK